MNDLITMRDYSKRLEMATLARLIEHRDMSPEEILTDNEAVAFSIIEDHLSTHYDTRNLFQSKRQKAELPIAEWVVSIVIHQLYAKSEYMTPDLVMLHYKSTMKDLQMIKEGKRLLDLPAKNIDSSGWDTLDDDLDFESPVYWGI